MRAHKQKQQAESISSWLMDLSASMLARDLKPNRLEALKATATEFIRNRPNDRIGLVEYAGESYTRTPLTTDKELLLKSFKRS